MQRFKFFATVIVTAVITSIFWIVLYNGAAMSGGADVPPGDAGTAMIEGPAPLVGPSGLAIPVAGISGRDLVDTYSQSRSGGARVHNAIDIMAPRGTPVLAAAPGTVEKLFLSEGGGGISAYVRSDDRQWIYYYAHLDAYAPGLREGQRVARGAAIGTVGSTGNANPEGPHLHFAVNRMARDEPWHGGTPVNPYPLLAGTAAAR
ncbi:MAG: family metallopeptidase [Alphaproteobacteria bacterium]|jgi:murein DD-endopeptidase MepM/ murein hydrolase activator NlpD|nr:family metallopeptidase [Alphaproteobacteria bacterium]